MSDISEEYLQFIEEYETANPGFETHMEDLPVLQLIDAFFKGTLYQFTNGVDFESFFKTAFEEEADLKDPAIAFYNAYWNKRDKEVKSMLN